MNISEASEYVKKAYDLMCAHRSTREMAGRLQVTLKTAANYRNRVNRIVQFNKPWEKATSVQKGRG